MTTKYQKFEAIEINRSKINLANYNPRKISDKAKKMLRENLKRVGLLETLVWNENTGNLVSGHQRITILDSLNKYNAETLKNDYLLTVAKVNLTLQEEREQNIFFNSTTPMGEFDTSLLKDIFENQEISINLENIGFDANDFNLIGIDIQINNDKEALEEKQAETKEEIKSKKQKIQADFNNDEEEDIFVSIMFKTAEEKTSFLEKLDLEEGTDMIMYNVLKPKLK